MSYDENHPCWLSYGNSEILALKKFRKGCLKSIESNRKTFGWKRIFFGTFKSFSPRSSHFFACLRLFPHQFFSVCPLVWQILACVGASKIYSIMLLRILNIFWHIFGTCKAKKSNANSKWFLCITVDPKRPHSSSQQHTGQVNQIEHVRIFAI